MPVAIPLIGVAVSAAAGGIQMAQANREKKKAQEAINGYKRQDLKNPMGLLSVSTLGAQMRQEASARALASIGYQTALGGSRAIAGTLPNVLEQQNDMEAQIAADLDQQQKQIDMMQANGQMQVMGMQEQRENNDLLGYGNLLNNANQQKASAMNQIAQAGASFAIANSAGLMNNNNSSSVAYKNAQIKNVLPGAEVSSLNPQPANYNSALPNNATLPYSMFNFPKTNQFSSNGKSIYQNPNWITELGGQYLGIKK